MSVSAVPFAIDSGPAAHALLLAESAARTVLDLRGDPPTGDLHLALFDCRMEADEALPDATDSQAVIAFMDRRLVAEHGSAGTGAVHPAIGVSPRNSCRLKAFECVRSGVDAYAAVIERRKFDGATRGFGSHRFEQIMPAGGSVPLAGAAAGWRSVQNYLAAMMVPATLQSVLLEYGLLPRASVVSSTFVLTAGAWEYPDQR
jgi:hypothetical protein